MKLLTIDSSSKQFSIALTADDKVIRHRSLVLEKRLSATITRHIKTICDKAKWTWADIDAFAIGLGPGSFTSLRVGVATIKALAYALHKPILGVCSLDLIALNAPPDYSDVAVILDARRNLVFAATYERTEQGGLIVKESPQLTDLASVLRKVKKNVAILGDGVKMIEASDRKRLKAQKCFIVEDESAWYPRAVNMPALVRERFKAKQFDNSASLVPLYLYAQDCQVRK